MLTAYTTYDEVRAALGVAEEEIPDAVLSLPNYELVLQFDLDELGNFNPTMRDLFATVTASTYAASVNEKRFASILQVYACYVIARHLLNSFEMFAPQIIKDSKTEMGRNADPYKDTRAGVELFYQQMRARLLAAYGVLFPLAAVPVRAPFFALIAVGLAVDPVTGA